MSDRRFLKPPSFIVSLRKLLPPTSTLPDGQPAMYEHDFGMLCVILWGSPKWNQDGWDEAMVRCAEAIDAAEVGGPVDLTLEDWTKLRDATNERAEAGEFKGPYAPQLRKMARAIKSAAKPAADAVQETRPS